MPPFHASRPRPRAVSAALWTALAVILALAAGGCSSSDSSSPAAAPGSPSSSATGAPPPMATTVVLGKVAGNVHQPNRRIFAHHRARLEKRVRHAVDAWYDGAFVGVAYPRAGFPDAFSSFTAAARKDAQHQKRLMTNWKWRRHIDGVTTTKRTVTLDVLAPHGRPAGVTARVHLSFRTSGHVQKKVTVTGRLFLSRDPHGAWRVFGFDVAKGAR